MKTVLFVDDYEDSQIAFKDFLQGYGYSVLTAGDGVEALEVMENTAVDLVITDYDMPQMNGGELIKRIKETWSQLPCILISGNQDLAALAKDAGADVSIKKGASNVAKRIQEEIARLLA